MGKRSKSPVWPEPSRLKAAAVHVKHDICMLQDAYQKKGERPAYIAWYVLCRSAMEFFDGCQPPKDESDVMAVQYFKKNPRVWTEARAKAGRPPDDYSSVRNWTNKLAAHLTYDRIGYEGKYAAQPFGEVTDYLWAVFEAFLAALTKPRRRWFDDARDPRDT